MPVQSSQAGVVAKVAALLKAVSAHEPDGASTSAVARAAAVARPTAHRLLSELEEVGFVERDRDTGRWLLGPEHYFLGEAASARYDVTAVAQPVVRRLALATGESAFFSARRGDETVCLIREDGSFPIRSHVLFEGIRFPLGVASAGLAILAYLAEREQDEFLAGHDLVALHGPHHSPGAVRKRLARTRDKGYALNPGLIVEGSWGMGAAVFDREGHPAWALSLTGIEGRFGRQRQHELGTLLLREAHLLTRALARPQG